MFLAAVVQLQSTVDKAVNCRTAADLIRQAAGRGAQFVATPETTPFLGSAQETARSAEALDGPTCLFFADLARKLSIHLLLGSFNERSEQSYHSYNTSVLFGPSGDRLAVYRKMHLFDCELPNGLRFQESEAVLPGQTAVVVPTPLARLGMSVCFDLRFGELYRRLVEMGADVLAIPSAFTSVSGRDHWEPLLRARAIESQCYVIAPGQWGRHDDSGAKESFGHSMIVDPWGQILAMVPDGPGFALAEIDLDRVSRIRRAMPLRGPFRK